MRIPPYTVIAGPIGVGKSTLTEVLSREQEGHPLYEQPDNNPYLPLFYAGCTQNMAFEVQLHFLGQRIKQCQEAEKYLRNGKRVIQDRSIYEDFHIFTVHHHQNGLISEAQFGIYGQLYEAILPYLKLPDCIVYLSAPPAVLMERIQQRGHSYEQTISFSYLDSLCCLYEQWIATIRLETQIQVIEIDTTQKDFQEKYSLTHRTNQSLSLS